MNATPLLATLLAAVHDVHLEVVLIGNAAAAMHGAPVTTLDFDFMFRETAANLGKLKRVAAQLNAMILRPFYPVSKLYRMVDDASGLQADFMPVIHGVRSFEGLRSRAVERTFANATRARTGPSPARRYAAPAARGRVGTDSGRRTKGRR